ncbi:class E sortase [Corynebacterium sp. MSK041]|nr:class E sortase [Corynebacterium sp. MSK041]MDK8796174.1 class E sortase [Corynebacterium sp. MSK041]
MTGNTRRVSAREVIGEVLLTFGVLLLLFAFYEAYWTNLDAGRKQAHAQEQLIDDWHNPRTNHTPALGDAFAVLRIPTFGADYQYAVVEGTDDASLLTGPGRYSDSQMPGVPGNFALAGHRVGKGAPFNDLGRLKACDEIVVETRDSTVTYRVLPMEAGAGRRAEVAGCLSGPVLDRVADGDYADVQGRHITLPSDIGVVAPHPGRDDPADSPDLLPVLTLTTCHPQFSNAERMIIHAVQTDITPKR